MNSSIKLTPSLQIGFSGHRHLSNESLCREAIVKVLKEWKAKWSDTVSGLSSLAAGGDLLFADACFELGIPLRVVLPMPQEQFKDDFDAPTWDRVQKALAHASCFEVVGSDTARPDCYYECGLKTIHQCTLLLLVWNGEPSKQIGDTGDIAEQSRKLGVPTIWIHSQTAEVTQWNIENLQDSDAELSNLNNLPDTGVSPGTDPKGQAVAWLSKLDSNATKVAPQFRRIIAVPILCSGIGALLTASSNIFENQSAFLLGGSALLGLAAFFAPKILKSKQRQERRAMIRAAAEISRSFIALWSASVHYSVIGKAELLELSGMVDALNHLKLVAGFRPRKEDIPAFKASYLRERIEDQAAYFLKQTKIADGVMSRARIVSRFVIFFSVTGNLLILVAKDFHWLPAGSWTDDLGLGTALALQIAAGLGAMLVINDYARRQQRYLEMRTLILHYGEQLEQARSWPSVLRIVTNVERALLAEVMEWRTLFKNQRFGK